MAAMSSAFGRVALTKLGAEAIRRTSMACGPRRPSTTEYSTLAPLRNVVTPVGRA